MSRLHALIEEYGYAKETFDADLHNADKNDPVVIEMMRQRKEIYALHREQEPPYLDYWHWITDCFEIHNGCDIEFSNETMDMAVHADAKCADKYPEFKGWLIKITEYLLAEFGEGVNREIKFHVWW